METIKRGALQSFLEYARIEGEFYVVPMSACAESYAEWTPNKNDRHLTGKRITAIEQKWTGARWKRTGKSVIVEDITFTNQGGI